MNELKDYLQDKINNNYHKLFYEKGNLDFEVKTIDCINAIEDLEKENKELQEKYNIRSKAYNNILLENASLHNKIDKAIDLLENCGDYYEGDFESMKFQYDVIKILKGDSKEN